MSSDFLDELEILLETLNAGGIILYPTDTIWGLGCDATNSEAIEKLYVLKQRPAEKSMVVLMSDVEMLFRHVDEVPPKALKLIEHYDRPLTIVYPNAKGISPRALAEDGSLAVRIPRDEFCRALITAFGKPLVATSANLSGHATPRHFLDIDHRLLASVDYTVRYRQADNRFLSPSTIIAFDAEGDLKVIRH